MVRPKVNRSLAYARAISRTVSTVPTDSAASRLWPTYHARVRSSAPACTTVPVAPLNVMWPRDRVAS